MPQDRLNVDHHIPRFVQGRCRQVTDRVEAEWLYLSPFTQISHEMLSVLEGLAIAFLAEVLLFQTQEHMGVIFDWSVFLPPEERLLKHFRHWQPIKLKATTMAFPCP